MSGEEIHLQEAIHDFYRARNQANLKELLGRLTGESTQLLSYDEVRQTLQIQGGIERGVRDIPLAAIVGSVGRYTDFTRDFLPREEVNPERWARIKIAASGMVGLPPVDVYQIGDIYFVKDGNHRVSVARDLGATHIQAYVTEVQSRVPLTPDIQPDELILKAEYNQFLEQTRLDQLRPEADLSLTLPGQYPLLLEHIGVHRYYMGLNLQRDVPYEEAVAHWYDTVYLPVVEIIRSQGLLRNFPERTETDLYLWIARHRAELEQQLGWKVRPEYAAASLADTGGPAVGSGWGRWGSKLLEIILPDKLDPGPPPGRWRTQALTRRAECCLFQDILVPVNGKQDGWCALEQALVVARLEGAALHGLHVVPGTDSPDSNEIAAVKQQFEQRCQQAGLPGSLLSVTGEVAEQTCQHAAGSDLVVVNLSHPPGAQPLARLSSGFHDLIRRCPRPILATPQTVSPLDRALLAFDGSPKGYEALLLATYLAGKWPLALFVISVSDGSRVSEATLNQARQHLEAYPIQANYILENGPVAAAILNAADENDCNLIICGGYGLNPMFEVVMGSTVDQLLRESSHPLLICR
jgi:nucleotide-binding universal stress UspA family protein